MTDFMAQFNDLLDTETLFNSKRKPSPHQWTEEQKVAKQIYDSEMRGKIGLQPNHGIK